MVVTLRDHLIVKSAALSAATADQRAGRCESNRRWPIDGWRTAATVHIDVMASPAGFEPATFRLEGGCSVH